MILRVDNYLSTSTSELDSVREFITLLEQGKVYEYQDLLDIGASREILLLFCFGMREIHPKAVLHVLAMHMCVSLSDIEGDWFEGARERLLSEINRLLAICERADASAELRMETLRKKAR
jgi:hypothetical protein